MLLKFREFILIVARRLFIRVLKIFIPFLFFLTGFYFLAYYVDDIHSIQRAILDFGMFRFAAIIYLAFLFVQTVIFPFAVVYYIFGILVKSVLYVIISPFYSFVYKDLRSSERVNLECELYSLEKRMHSLERDINKPGVHREGRVGDRDLRKRIDKYLNRDVNKHLKKKVEKI